MRLFKKSTLGVSLATILLVLPFSVFGAELHVVDGDTLSIDGVHYRLHGIDAPEAGQRCRARNGGTWRCGDEATRHLVDLLGDAIPHCDNRGSDGYDRILSVCRIEERDINRAMVLDGYAWAFRRYSEDYVDDEVVASSQSLEIWQAPTETAWDYRANRWEVEVQQSPGGCPIKGNISKNGRIYHTPWSPWYAKTRLTAAKGERWFCTEREALDAGWRAPIWGR